MANTSGIANSFKVELLAGVHVLNATGSQVTRSSTAADTVKAALFTTGATIGPATTTYTSTGELTGTGYNAGGVSITTNLLSLDTTTAIWQPSAAIVWSGITFNSVDTVMFYNSTVTNNKSIGVYTFSSQSITSGTFTLTMPAFNAASALLRIS